MEVLLMATMKVMIAAIMVRTLVGMSVSAVL